MEVINEEEGKTHSIVAGNGNDIVIMRRNLRSNPVCQFVTLKRLRPPSGFKYSTTISQSLIWVSGNEGTYEIDLNNQSV